MGFIPWLAFIVLVTLLLALDLGVLNRKAHVIGTKEALKWTIFWIFLALLFGVAVYFMYDTHWMGIGIHEGADDDGKTALMNYLTGYIIEKTLSLDNIAVIALIFGYFQVPLQYQHRVLFWGIIGAIVLRGVMIAIGAAAVAKFHWVLYIFGVFLVYMAIKTMFAKHDDEKSLADNKVIKIAKKFMPVTDKIDGLHFFAKVDGKTAMTPLFLALLMVESSDVIFAVDSIPAIFVVTTDPFIVFTSNIFAILGLRSLYFVLASILDRFRFMKFSIGFILLYVAIKMFIAHYVPIPNWLSLVVVSVAITMGILVSMLYDKGKKKDGCCGGCGCSVKKEEGKEGGCCKGNDVGKEGGCCKGNDVGKEGGCCCGCSEDDKMDNEGDCCKGNDVGKEGGCCCGCSEDDKMDNEGDCCCKGDEGGCCCGCSDEGEAKV